jgi:hypothetical protein
MLHFDVNKKVIIHDKIYLYKASFHFLVDRLAWSRPNNAFHGNHILKSQVINPRMRIRKLIR